MIQIHNGVVELNIAVLTTHIIDITMLHVFPVPVRIYEFTIVFTMLFFSMALDLEGKSEPHSAHCDRGSYLSHQLLKCPIGIY